MCVHSFLYLQHSDAESWLSDTPLLSFPLCYPNMKKAVIKCSKNDCLRSLMLYACDIYIEFVFWAYNLCGFRDYFVPESLAVGHNEE